MITRSIPKLLACLGSGILCLACSSANPAATETGDAPSASPPAPADAPAPAAPNPAVPNPAVPNPAVPNPAAPNPAAPNLPTPGTATVETGDAVAPTSGAEPTAEELPVPEDFEEEVEAEIDAQNYLQALDTLDRELEGDEQAVDAD